VADGVHHHRSAGATRIASPRVRGGMCAYRRVDPGGKRSALRRLTKSKYLRPRPPQKSPGVSAPPGRKTKALHGFPDFASRGKFCHGRIQRNPVVVAFKKRTLHLMNRTG
jgi:hypothetical protein